MTPADTPTPPIETPEVTRVRTADGTTLACRYLPGNGQLIVAIHGFTGDGTTMLELVETCREGRPAILIDVIGHGQSDTPEHVEHYTMASVVDQVLSVIGGHEPLTVHLVGYSMGGRIALSMAARAPWYFASITLLSSTAGIADPAKRAERYDQDQKTADGLEQRGLDLFIEDWLKLPLFGPYVSSLDDTRRSQTIEQRTSSSPIGLANSLRGTGTGSMPPLWGVLPSIRSPLLSIAGSLDTTYAAIAKDLGRAAAFGQTAIIDDVGHVVHHENLGEVAAIVRRFLTECEHHADHER